MDEFNHVHAIMTLCGHLFVLYCTMYLYLSLHLGASHISKQEHSPKLSMYILGCVHTLFWFSIRVCMYTFHVHVHYVHKYTIVVW